MDRFSRLFLARRFFLDRVGAINRPSHDMKAELIPENGDPPIPITRDLTVVGRREFADVVIDHPSVSKRHCVLVKTDGLLVIRDLITTNGTKVKGQRTRWAALLPDDRIALGGYKMRVYLGPDDVPSPSELWARRDESPKDARRSEPAASEFGTRGLPAFQGFAAPSPLDLPVVPESRDDRLRPSPSPRDSRFGGGEDIEDLDSE